MLEKILRFSINHRLLVVFLTLILAVFGLEALRRLPIDAVPDITNNQVQINTIYAAFSPGEIEKQITFPIENALTGIPGLQYTRSLSRNGFSQVTAVFADNVDIYFARQQVLERLSQAKEELAAGSDPKIGPIATGLGEIYMWAVEYTDPEGAGAIREDGKPGWQTDGTYLSPEGEYLRTKLERASYLREVQDWIIRPQLRNVSGVASIDVIGGYVKHYEVAPDPLKLLAHSLTVSEIVDALERNNVSTGAGYVEHRGEAYIVRSTSRVSSEIEIRNIVVAERNGLPIRVADIASVGIGEELRTGSASKNGHEVVIGTALMLIGENSRTVSSAVDAKLTEINRSLPPGIKARTVLNRTKLVNATIATVQKNLLEGAILVIVVLLILLGNLRAAIITSLAIPLSMLFTAIGMVQGKISGNLMSLGAIDFGLIVDGAVIIVENCIRRLGERQNEVGRELTVKERLETVHAASKEVRGATAFGETIIIIVYVPILFLIGIEGKMFQPMALTVIFALASAFILSLTFIPALVALVIRGPIRDRESFLVTRGRELYKPILLWALQHRTFVIGGALSIFIVSIVLFSRLGQEFIPILDEKDIALHAVRIPSTGIKQSQEMQFQVEQALLKFPEVELVFSKTGTAEIAFDPMHWTMSDTFVILKPVTAWLERKNKNELIKQMEDVLARLPGNVYEFTQPIQMRFNELIAGVRSDVAVKVFGDEFEKMMPTAQAIAAVIKATSGAADVKVEQTQGLPFLDVQLNREMVGRLGLSLEDVQDQIETLLQGRAVGQVFQGDRRFDLVVRFPAVIRADLERIKNLPIALRKADSDETTHKRMETISKPPLFVPLSTLADIKMVEGLNQVSRENGKRRVVVQANVRGRDIGSFVEEVQKKIAQEVKIPPGYWITWGGQFENLRAAKQRLLVVVPICLFLIMFLLYTSFKSIAQALMVFSGVPLALSGGIFALWLRGMPFSISAAVGFVALSGVAVLNGLVMVSFFNQLMRAGRSAEEAVIEGGVIRLRPVLMTALVAAFGFLPMALATGTGAEVQRPIATVVIGGILSATALTLIVLPALYSLASNWRILEKRLVREEQT